MAIWGPSILQVTKDGSTQVYSTRHFLGSYNMTMQVLDDAETILYTIYDSKSFESMTDHQSKRGYEERFGTTYQRYMWTEKISKSEWFEATHYFFSDKKILPKENQKSKQGEL